MSTEIGQPQSATLQRVIETIQAKTDIPVSPDSTMDSVGLDSLAMAEILLDLETEFGIQTDDHILDLGSVRDVAAYIDAAVAKKKL